MIHEYIEDLNLLVDALQTAHENLDFLIGVAQAISTDLDSRGIVS